MSILTTMRHNNSGVAMKAVYRRIMRSNAMSFAVGWSTARLTSTYLRSLRVHMTYEIPEYHHALSQKDCIYCSWHENIFLSSYIGAFGGTNVLVSESSDGNFVSRILESLGYRTVRGSTTRGAVRAVRRLLRSGQSGHLAITPDGPRGPRRSFQQGAVYLASRTGMPIVPVGFAFDQPWRFSSWDRMALPRPFSRAVCYGGTPVEVPRDCNAAGLAHFRNAAAETLNRVTDRAEDLLSELPADARFSQWGPGRQRPVRLADTGQRISKAA